MANSLSQGMLQAKALARSKELMAKRTKDPARVARKKARAEKSMVSEMARVARVARGRDYQRPSRRMPKQSGR